MSNIQNMDKNKYDYDKIKVYEVSSKEFIDYINRLDSAKFEDKDYYKRSMKNLEIALCTMIWKNSFIFVTTFYMAMLVYLI